MKLLVFAIINCLVFNCFSQERLMYNGVFKGNNTVGEAEYEYYENEKFERIFDGVFEYNAVLFESGSELNLSIVGNYKENKKHGNWKYNLTLNEPSKNYESLISSVSGEYSNGSFDGEWTFKRTKVFNISGARNKLIENNEVAEYSKANFSDNKLVGEFIYDNGNFKVEGNFDNDGFFDGTWRVTWEDANTIPHEEIRRYKNGFCYMLIFRDLSTGRIINTFDRSDLINNIQTTDILRDSIIFIDEEKYNISLIDENIIDNAVYSERDNQNYQGIRHIYDAISFWACSRSVNYHFLTSTDDIQFIHDNYIFEIDHGVKNIYLQFEKRIASYYQQKEEKEKANLFPVDTVQKTEGLNGLSSSLIGRTPVSLPLPEYNVQVEGTVVVEVTVNRDGDVISATPGVRGTTILHEQILDSARRAAERAKFNAALDAPAYQRGTITYNFRLE